VQRPSYTGGAALGITRHAMVNAMIDAASAMMA
jgi:hypothetical protein